MRFLILFAALSLHAQPLVVVPGSIFGSPINILPGDSRCAGQVQAAAVLGPGAWLGAVEYGAAIACDLAVPNGLYMIQVATTEPRNGTTTLPAPAIGARVFTVTANGMPSPPLDVFKLVGAQQAYTLQMFTAAGAGWLHVAFTAAAGNAVWRSITITPLQITSTNAGGAPGTPIGLAVWLGVLAAAPGTTPSPPLQ
jgi:hypothetical protein